MKNLAVHFSSETDDWATPQAFFDLMNEKYGPFNLDVCATAENKKVASYLGPDGIGLDGLTSPWRIAHYSVQDDSFGYGARVQSELIPAVCWMNPPYGRGIGEWVKKAYEASLEGCKVVCLLPARTDTKWFHDYCINGKIEFIKGRLKFGNAKNSAPFPSMIVRFGYEE